jgi:outer membrane protein OmpA-like peptidoglycan-associated protein
MRKVGIFAGTLLLTMGTAVAAKAQEPAASSQGPTLPGEADKPSPGDQAATGNKASSASDWEKQRGYSLYRHNSLHGNTGLVHLVSADSGAPGTFRLSYMSSYYSGSGFLCPDVQSCGGRPAKVTDTQDSASRTGTDLSISATLLPFLEAAVGAHSQAFSDNFGTPSVIQVLSDSYVGLKGFTPRQDRIFSAGGLGQLRFLNSAGGIGIHTANITLAALGTLDLMNRSDPAQRIPIRLHGNLGYLFDNSSKIAEDIEASRHHPINRIEREGFGINRVDSFFLGVGGEYMGKILQPFAEWTLDIASNRQGYKCVQRNLSPGDRCLVRISGISGTPSRLTLGTRLTPQFHGLTAMAAFDIATSGSSAFSDERAPELPWDFYIGLGYMIDTVEAPTVVAQASAPRVVQVPPPPEHHILGTVVDEESSQPIAHALISFDGQDLTGLVTRANGSFDSGNVKPGEYKLLVSADGYKDGSCVAKVDAAATDAKTPPAAAVNTEIKCTLKAAPALGTLFGNLVAADSNAPVPHAAIKVRDERDRALDLQSNEVGDFRVENVPEGQVHMSISATGYLPMAVDMEIKRKVQQHTSLVLHKLPKKANVSIAQQELKLTTPIRFEGPSAEVAHDSMPIVQEVAAVLNQHQEVTSVEIQVYTDEEGSPAYNQRLSEQRAGSIRSGLSALGVDSTRLTAKGFGSEKPKVPNAKTEADRAKNRRVQFVIGRN